MRQYARKRGREARPQGLFHPRSRSVLLFSLALVVLALAGGVASAQDAPQIAPTLTVDPHPSVIDEGETITIVVEAVVGTGFTPTLFVSSGPSGYTFSTVVNGQTRVGTFTWTADEFDGGADQSVTFRAVDTTPLVGGDSSTVTRTFFVREVNNAPTLAAISDRTVNEANADDINETVFFTLLGSDTDFPLQTLTYSIDSGGQPGMTLNAITGAFSWSPTESQGGATYPLLFRVTDNGSPPRSATRGMSITVNKYNDAPTLTPIGGKATNEANAQGLPSSLNFTVSASDGDLPAQTLTYTMAGTITAADLPLGATLNPNTGAFAWSPAENQGGRDWQITFTVTDDGAPARSASENVIISVAEVNEPPQLDAISDKTVDEGETLTFTATASDSDHPTQTLTFSLAAGAPVGAAINANSGVFTWTPGEADGGATYPITVQVTDGLATTGQTLQVAVVEVNSPPTLDVGPSARFVDEGVPLTFTVTASDPDIPAQTVALSASGLPAGASFEAASGAFAWTPTEAQGPGEYLVTFTATDDEGGEADAVVTITVNEVNIAPTLLPIPNQEAFKGQIMSFTLSATDPDQPPNALIFSIVGGAQPGMTLDATSGAFTWPLISAVRPGEYPVSFIVTDSAGAESPPQGTILTVSERNLLQNAGFETPAKQPTRAKFWRGSGLLTTDKRVCGITPPARYYGPKAATTCMFQFSNRADGQAERSIRQQVSVATVPAFGTIKIAGMVEARNLTRGARLILEVRYTSSQSSRKTALRLVAGPKESYALKYVERQIVLAGTPTQMTLWVTTGPNSKGRLRVDDLLVTVVQLAPLATDGDEAGSAASDLRGAGR